MAPQVIEYDPTTLAPLGMVVSRDELLGRKVRRNAPWYALWYALCNACDALCHACNALCPALCNAPAYVMRQVAVIDSGLKSEQCGVFEDGAECVDQSSREQARIIL